MSCYCPLTGLPRNYKFSNILLTGSHVKAPLERGLGQNCLIKRFCCYFSNYVIANKAEDVPCTEFYSIMLGKVSSECYFMHTYNILECFLATFYLSEEMVIMFY